MDYLLLADSEKFKKFYRLLCKMTGLSLVLASPDSDHRIFLDYDRNVAPLCSFLRRHPLFNKQCRQCDRSHCEQAVKERSGFYYDCHIGLIDIVVPIFIKDKHVGTFMGGQILPEPPSKESFDIFYSKIESYEFDKETVEQLYFDTPWMAPEKLEAAFELIKMFAEHFYELGPRLFESNIQEPALEKVKRYIYDNLTSEITLEDVASVANFTPTYFSRWFRNKCNTGFLDYLQQKRIEKACRFLETTNYDIARIAYDSGFTSLTTFNRVFRKIMNQNPRDYRKSKADA